MSEESTKAVMIEDLIVNLEQQGFQPEHEQELRDYLYQWVREAAFLQWKNEDEVHGRDVEHWRLACQQFKEAHEPKPKKKGKKIPPEAKNT